jgi:ubiquinone/menaquinone biosynthesis C-methylase UbiE
VPGCGNSDLSEKLLTKLGVSNIEVHSVDYEDAVVKKMEEAKPKDLPLTYTVGDVTKLTGHDEGTYQYAVDKGTLDAIAVDDKPETVKMCHDYFREMVRVLKSDGTFMVVSLLQPHVLKIFLDFFIKNDNFEILYTVKINRIEHIEGYAEKQFIKYFVSVRKTAINTSNEKMLDMRTKF